MTVQQLQALLATMPPTAVVLMEADGGLSAVSGLELQPALQAGLPDEVLLQADMTPD